jgi:hypothetical protein
MTVRLEEAIHQVEALTPDEQFELVATIVEKLRMKAKEGTKKTYSWKAAIGTVPYPLTGEDAQNWVTRTRAEGDEERESQWRR